MRLRELMQGIVPNEHLGQLSNRFHVIGDVAILSLPPGLEVYGKQIAMALLSHSKNIHTVLNKTSHLEGERRVAKFEHLAGDGTVTVHKEFGFVYRLDITRVFFNSHLGYERVRVATLVREGEHILVPFAGVGPFVVPLAARDAQVIAIEKNREACLWLAENARQNDLMQRITIINGDAFHAAKLLKMDFDRVVIPTPYGMDEILETVISKVKAGGMMHFYTFKRPQQIDGLKESYADQGLKVVNCRKCGNVAPGVCRWAFDMMKLAI